MPMTPKQMICLLKQHGFVLVNSNDHITNSIIQLQTEALLFHITPKI